MPGLVIRYSYLGLREHAEGREEGEKDRPCAIILTVARESGPPKVTVLPVTHRMPADPTSAVEIPPATKQRLGLDPARSWIILEEGNDFIWPGPDLRAVPGSSPSSASYGFLPPGLFKIVVERFLALAQHRRRVPRS